MKWCVFPYDKTTSQFSKSEKYLSKNAYSITELNNSDDLQKCLDDFTKYKESVIVFLDFENRNNSIFAPSNVLTHIPIRKVTLNEDNTLALSEYKNDLSMIEDGFILKFKSNLDALKKIVEMYEKNMAGDIVIGAAYKISIDDLRSSTSPTKAFVKPTSISS